MSDPWSKMVVMDPMAAFSEPTRRWFESAFAGPTEIQAVAWPRIQAGVDVLAVAPTGSGKTLAAFLCAIDRCLTPRPEPGVRVLYVSPMKALAVDVERNLRAPLAGIATRCDVLGMPRPGITVALRTGDTTTQERRVMARRPPDVLITTPESLFLMLTSATRSILTAVESVIVDEVHAMAGSKRGAHLAVSLARLDHLVGRRVPRVGLSATVRPTSVAAQFLGGDRHVEVLEQGSTKEWELSIQVPVEDLGELGTGTGPDGSPSASIWPHVEQRIVDLIEGHRSTIVFANSRRLSERLTARLNEIHAERTAAPVVLTTGTGPPAQIMAQAGASLGAPALLARAHHGSVSKEQRAQIEDDLKRGRLRAVVATSSYGFSDLIVGAYHFDNGEVDEGRAFVYHGSAAGPGLSAAWTAECDQAGASFGFSVGTAGDVNNDGFSDVIVGAVGYDHGETDEGRAFVYHGSATGLGPSSVWTAESDQVGANLGNSAGTAGDVNGDGFSDVIVGAYLFVDFAGKAFVYVGAPAGLGTSPAWVATGNPGSTFGNSVGTAGDVNRDGYSDVIVGAMHDGSVGRAFAYHGSAAGLSTFAAWTAAGTQLGSGLGCSVGTAGDVERGRLLRRHRRRQRIRQRGGE